MSTIIVDNQPFSVVEPLEGIQVVDSFVKKNKLEATTGHGEARLYVGSQDRDFGRFFNEFRDRGFFLKKDLLEYLDNAKEEYRAQEQRYRRDISEDLAGYYEILRQYPGERLSFTFESATGAEDRSRFYIRSSDDVFCEHFRSIALPIITHLSILKLKTPSGEFLFYFRPFLDYAYDREHHPAVLTKEEEAIRADQEISIPEKEQLVKARYGQGRYRQKLLELMSGCVITGVNDERVLIAGHIKPWASSSNREKTDPNNGLVLTPTYDRLFDQGFISFDEDGRLLTSPYISPLNQKRLNLLSGKRYEVVVQSEERRRYLQYHREYVFKT